MVKKDEETMVLVSALASAIAKHVRGALPAEATKLPESLSWYANHLMAEATLRLSHPELVEDYERLKALVALECEEMVARVREEKRVSN